MATCLTNRCKPGELPPPQHILAPWVKITINNNGTVVTVGNESAPGSDPKHSACIMSMNFGLERSTIAKVTIHDEAGSSFVGFMEMLVKDLKCNVPGSNPIAQLDFGWVTRDCHGVIGLDKNQTKYFMIVLHIGCSFNSGKFVYELELTDKLNIHDEARVAKLRGNDGDQGVYMTDAITKLLTDQEYPPSVGAVEFKKLLPDKVNSVPIRFKYHDGDPEKGVKGRWEPNNVDKLNAVQEWLSKNVSEDGKGFIITYDASTPDGKIVIWEDPSLLCGEKFTANKCDKKSYVVNGGKDSRVISFNPSFRWTFSHLTASGGSMPNFGGNDRDSATGGKNVDELGKCEDLKRSQIKSGGVQNTITPSQIQVDKHGSNSQKVSEETLNASIRANYDISAISSIEAELVIVGDPNFKRASLVRGEFIEILFLNPFHLRPSADSNNPCFNWMATPLCNEVLTNSAWDIQSVNHQIELGKYYTTVKIRLAAPGSDVNVGDPFGGPGSGGWKPPPACR